MTTSFPSLAGHFLIAMPLMRDPHFAESVVYILTHDTEGALGIIINRPSGLTLADVLEQLQPTQGKLSDSDDQDVFFGGPVQSELGFVLHNSGPQFQGTMTFGSVSLTSSQDALAAIAQGQGPEQNLIILGHAGWGAGQLEEELRDNAWLSCPADLQVIFNTPVEQRRSAAAALLGVDLERLSHQVGHA